MPRTDATPIEEFRAELLRRRRALLHQVGHVEADLRQLDENVEPELEEEAQEENTSRVLSGLDDRGHAELAAIDAALARIETGSYGTCEHCAERIPLERLRAVPTATTCIHCSEERERS
jgi:RNA polymerase-binding protein DksA